MFNTDMYANFKSGIAFFTTMIQNADESLLLHGAKNVLAVADGEALIEMQERS